MTKARQFKKTKSVVPGENIYTFNLSAADGVKKSAQAHVSASGAVATGNCFAEAHSTDEPSTRTIFAGGSVERNNKSPARGLLPVKHKQSVGTSYAQSATFPGKMLFGERSSESFHKVQVFSSQKKPQPFLDR